VAAGVGRYVTARVGATACSTVSNWRMKRSGVTAAPQHVLLDILANFTLFATDKKNRRLKIVPLPAVRRRQPDRAARAGRVSQERAHLALSRLGQIAADGLCRAKAAHAAALRNPTVIIVVDRIDLDAKSAPPSTPPTSPTWSKQTAASAGNPAAQDTRKIIITTIFKFGDVGANHGPC
jgi:type I restriction enzyme R subunit